MLEFDNKPKLNIAGERKGKYTSFSKECTYIMMENKKNQVTNLQTSNFELVRSSSNNCISTERSLISLHE